MIEKFTLDFATAKKLLPVRDENANKGDFGHVLIVAGSMNMIGCAVLAAQGALRSGAGLVTVAFPDCLTVPLMSRLTETLFLPLPTDPNGVIDSRSLSILLKAAAKADAVLYGCGVGVSNQTRLILEGLLHENETPTILDADALNVAAKNTSVFRNASCKLLLTPHPGEMSRLMWRSVESIEKDRIAAVTAFCSDFGVNLLLKGHETLICRGGGDAVYINHSGNTGLAKGGSGDLLAGIIAGLSPNMKDLFSAACLGTFVHGAAADLLKEKMTEYAMLPSDCAEVLPDVYREILHS